MNNTYAIQLNAENFDRVTNYLMDNSDLIVPMLKITDYVILHQDIRRRYRQWKVATPEEFAAQWEFTNGFSYLYFRGIKAV